MIEAYEKAKHLKLFEKVFVFEKINIRVLYNISVQYLR